jgi:hypothetical protein
LSQLAPHVVDLVTWLRIIVVVAKGPEL